MRTPVSVGVVCGEGGRGDVLVRVLDALPQATLRWVCDRAPRVASVGYGPETAWTRDFDELLQDEDLDAIAFGSTDLAACGHAHAALLADKHVFVDGPLAATSAESDGLLSLAAGRNRRVHAHWPALLRPSVRRLHRLIARGALGEIYYVHARRYAPRPAGPLDLLADEGLDVIALVLDLLADEPVEAVARGESYLDRDGPDVLFARLDFATGIGAYVHLSCLEGDAVEQVSVVGSNATATLDTAAPGRELSLVVHGTDGAELGDLGVEPGARIDFRVGQEDTLRTGCGRFLSAVRGNGEAAAGRESSAVLAVVEALQASVRNRGTAESIASRSGPAPENVVAFRGR